MLSHEVKKLETENYHLRKALNEIQEKMDAQEIPKPKDCRYCKYFVQHYAKGGFPAYRTEYIEINAGHCIRGVSVKNGGKRTPKPDDTCRYFELGTNDWQMEQVGLGGVGQKGGLANGK